MKQYHLISNAHLDPVWQWDWEEGAAAAMSTFRCAARFCREFDGYIFCHNESLLYRWVEEYEPSLFAEIQALVKLGKWHIMGGWHVQPDCNLPSGEGFARQITEGRRYFAEKFGVEPTTAINFDPFGHTRGLVQIMAKSGYDSYIFCRPSAGFITLPAETFRWVGYDGSSVMGQRCGEGYNTGLGHSLDKIRAVENRDAAREIGICLWGVGNHGGGPSRVDIRMIDDYIKECRAKGIEVIHSTPETYFSAVRESGMELPEHAADLNLWAPGCYTSQVRIKQKYRQTENLLFATEKMYTQLCGLGKADYPELGFSEVLYDLLTVQFHDMLPGSSVKSAEETALRMLDHACEILSRLRMKALMLLSEGQAAAKENEIPVLVYNPHPYPVTEDIACEFMLTDQNWSGSYFLPVAYRGEEKLPSQCEKEESNIPLDWRKRVVFRATLAPMSLNRFDCKLTELPSKPVYVNTAAEGTHFHFESERMAVDINRATGLVDRWVVDGVNRLGSGSLSIDVMRDSHDSWGMTYVCWRERIGAFSLLSDEAAGRFADQDAPLPAMRVIEDGAVRTVVEVLLGYGESYARVRYALSKCAPMIDLDIRVVNADKRKMFKLGIVPARADIAPALEVSFGEEPMRREGVECVGQKYMAVRSPEGGGFAVLNRGIYGASYETDAEKCDSVTGKLYLTLLHSPGYTAHPIGDRPVLPSDRHNDHMEQGERDFSLRLVAGEAMDDLPRMAQSYNELPMTLNVFPSGEDAVETPVGALPYLTLEGDKCVVLSAFKQSEDGRDTVIRLYNSSDRKASATLQCPHCGLNETVFLGKYAVETYRLRGGKLLPCRIDEK